MFFNATDDDKWQRAVLDYMVEIIKDSSCGLLRFMCGKADKLVSSDKASDFGYRGVVLISVDTIGIDLLGNIRIIVDYKEHTGFLGHSTNDLVLP